MTDYAKIINLSETHGIFQRLHSG